LGERRAALSSSERPQGPVTQRRRAACAKLRFVTVERVAYDEFSYFADNAAEWNIALPAPPTVARRSAPLPDGRHLSALVWGERPAELVLLHGGAQNAHTWDTVALALGRPLVAIDLPGHGHSSGPRNDARDVADNADDVALAVAALAPEARVVVGMSLGGLTALELADRHPHLVASLVLVDVTPGVNGAKAKAISDFVNGPASFPDFDAILARTVEHNPGRSVSSLRRGILHNAEQLDDGTWVWRYARFRSEGAAPGDFAARWAAVERLSVPTLLVRGMRPQSVVDDADEAEFLRRARHGRVERVDAGHSVQGDAPLELAAILDAVVSEAADKP
jgi:pimeloyl-ACP methyl ester carboxylesterase